MRRSTGAIEVRFAEPGWLRGVAALRQYAPLSSAASRGARPSSRKRE